MNAFGMAGFHRLNVIYQVRNVASDVFVKDAWARGQPYIDLQIGLKQSTRRSAVTCVASRRT
jgi:hypothetical protein